MGKLFGFLVIICEIIFQVLEKSPKNFSPPGNFEKWFRITQRCFVWILIEIGQYLLKIVFSRSRRYCTIYCLLFFTYKTVFSVRELCKTCYQYNTLHLDDAQKLFDSAKFELVFVYIYFENRTHVNDLGAKSSPMIRGLIESLEKCEISVSSVLQKLQSRPNNPPNGSMGRQGGVSK